MPGRALASTDALRPRCRWATPLALSSFIRTLRLTYLFIYLHGVRCRGGGAGGRPPLILEKLISIHSAPPDFGGFCRHTLEFYCKRIKKRNIFTNFFIICSKFSQNFQKSLKCCIIFQNFLNFLYKYCSHLLVLYFTVLKLKILFFFI